MKKTSFSLIEIMIGLSIVMIICAFLPVRFFDFERAMLFHELDMFFVTFSYLQQRAIACQSSQELIFDLKKNSYSYLQSTGKLFVRILPQTVSFGFFQGAHGPPSDPRFPIKTSLTFPMQQGNIQIVFFADGKITPGTVYLVDKQRKNMVALTVPVSQVSYVRKYDYHQKNNKWVCLE